MQSPKLHSSTKTALIDGDIVVYAAAFAAQKIQYNLHLVEGESVQETPAQTFLYKKELNNYLEENSIEEFEVRSSLLVEPLSYALSNAKSMIHYIQETLTPKEIVVFLSGEDNFREKIATYSKYKGNRDSAPVPIHKDAVIDYLKRVFGAVVIDGQEADDAMGIRQCGDIDSTIICSSDKDLKQIPGWHYHIPTASVLYQPTEDADRMFYCQAMTGDPTDNIAGCPGVGAATAEKYYDADNPWQSVLACYRDKLSKKSPEGLLYNEEEDFVKYTSWDGQDMTVPLNSFVVEQARLVRIRRTPNELWTPDE